jgi:hypothetical protein
MHGEFPANGLMEVVALSLLHRFRHDNSHITPPEVEKVCCAERDDAAPERAISTTRPKVMPRISIVLHSVHMAYAVVNQAHVWNIISIRQRCPRSDLPQTPY